jgi:hypothetical protein
MCKLNPLYDQTVGLRFRARLSRSYGDKQDLLKEGRG